jgi:hypothetical protein
MNIIETKVLTFDITVYKVQVKPDGGNEFESIIYCHKPKYNKVEIADGKIVLGYNPSPEHQYRTIGKGVFHFYTTTGTARAVVDGSCSLFSDSVFRVVECTLKRGSKVYVGDDDEIACRQAIFTEKVVYQRSK